MRGFKELKIGFPVKLKSEKVEEAKEAVQRFGMKKLEKAKEKEKKPLGKTIKKTVQKAAAVGTAGALILAFVIPFGLSTISHTEKISALNDEPAPITMDISDYDAADIADDGSDEEQEEKKIGFFKRITHRIISTCPRIMQRGLVRTQIHLNMVCSTIFPQIDNVSLICE